MSARLGACKKGAKLGKYSSSPADLQLSKVQSVRLCVAQRETCIGGVENEAGWGPGRVQQHQPCRSLALALLISQVLLESSRGQQAYLATNKHPV